VPCDVQPVPLVHAAELHVTPAAHTFMAGPHTTSQAQASLQVTRPAHEFRSVHRTRQSVAEPQSTPMAHELRPLHTTRHGSPGGQTTWLAQLPLAAHWIMQTPVASQVPSGQVSALHAALLLSGRGPSSGGAGASGGASGMVASPHDLSWSPSAMQKWLVPQTWPGAHWPGPLHATAQLRTLGS